MAAAGDVDRTVDPERRSCWGRWCYSSSPGPAFRGTGGAGPVGPKEVGLVLFGPYLIGVELTSLLLMGALVAAYHLGWHRPKLEKANVDDSHGARGASPGGDFVRAWG
ncbi:MAG: hypothetical protein MPW15_02000 [Candidatus Manganitrophus sp.]|nr:hypothetical protein [Candidatus Manganitrophus sp.]